MKNEVFLNSRHRHSLDFLVGLLSMFSLCATASSSADVAALQRSSPREVTELIQGWSYRPITMNKKSASRQAVDIPHTWNVHYVEGTTTYNREMMVYERALMVTEAMENKRLFLYFEGVNSSADVFVNHRSVGAHLGGYTAFCLEITEAVHPGENVLEVWVSNAYRTDVLPISGDFNVYGGIHRPCRLIVTEKNCISPVFYASPGVLVRQINVTDRRADVSVETALLLAANCNLSTKTTTPAAEYKQSLDSESALFLKTKILDADNRVLQCKSSIIEADALCRMDGGDFMKQSFSIEHPRLWNGLVDPYLYTISVALYQGERLIDEVTQPFGLRYFRADADRGFFLNGKPYRIYGFCRHDDFKDRGSALTASEYETDMALIKESGATGMRLAHYPHGEPIYRLCDENGIVLWTEIPMCGPGGYDFTGYLHNEGFENNARQVTKELVYQKFNHPSIFFWGIFNELLLSNGKQFQEYDYPVPFVQEINRLYKSLDSSRLTVFATCVDQQPYLDAADLAAWNKYFSWKNSQPSAAAFFDQAKADAKGKPMGVSEYGAAASILHHCDTTGGVSLLSEKFHPEEYQNICHEGYWAAFVERPYLWATFIWQFSDMQSTIRHEGDTEGINDKGAVTYDRKNKKDIFYFYKANWNPEPMLYISSRRFENRTQAVTPIKVYSNLDEAILYVNGKKIGKARKDNLCRMVWNDVLLQPGQNEIRVRSNKAGTLLEDSCVWTLR